MENTIALLDVQIDRLNALINPNEAKINEAFRVIRRQKISPKTRQFMQYNLFCLRNNLNPSALWSFQKFMSC
jgi:hypothetical protein